MRNMDAGDLVCAYGTSVDMIVLSRADEVEWTLESTPSVFCAWEQKDVVHTKLFRVCDLLMVRKERRRVPRGGRIEFPSVD